MNPVRPPVLDLAALREQLAEYDPSAPRCSKKVAEHRNYAPDGMAVEAPEWSDFTITTYTPCARPAGHEGECRNSRRVMGWPGRATLIALLDEVEHLRAASLDLRADLVAARRVAEKHDRLQERLTMIERANVDRWKDGYAAAERQIAAWLDEPCGLSGHDDRWCPACSFRADIANSIRDGKHRDRREEEP